jgi:creatinine amidohydrolase
MLIEALTMTEFEEQVKKNQTLLLPVGSIEEHGGHLPLGTDTIHADALCRQASEKTGALVAPAIYYGVCRSTSQHPGTISISGDTLRALIKDIGLAFYRQGIRNFIILSGHAGGTHTAALVEAGEYLLENLSGTRVASLNVLDLAASAWSRLLETPDDSHAGELETSVMMVLRPAWVKKGGQAERPSFPKGILVRNKRKFWPGGVWGDPTRAGFEKGTACLEAAVEALIQLIEQVENWED